MRSSAIIALTLVFAAMLLTSIVSDVIFERLPHLEDEYAYLFQARIFAAGDSYIETPDPSNAYWQPFLLNLDGKRFGKYPPGYPMLLAIGAGVGLPWVVNVWFAGLNVAMAYRVARDLYDSVAGIAASVLLTISPIALLLNGSLMSHTTTLFFVLVFIYSLLRLERSKRWLLWWGAIGGISLGMVIASRPLVSVGVAAPFIVYSVLRLLWPLRWSAIRAKLNPLVVLGCFTLLVGSFYFAFNYVVSGDSTTNLYTYIWEYDSVGFGEGHGRHSGREAFIEVRDGVKIYMRTHKGHSLERGWDILKRDTGCYSRDLFGFTQYPDDPPTEINGRNECLSDSRGLSWVLLPFSTFFVVGAVWQRWSILPHTNRRWWKLFSLSWQESKWTMLLLAMAATVIGVHLAYWIGAGVYSSRYYFEATAPLVIVSGAGISGLWHVVKRYLPKANYELFVLLAAMAFYSLYVYSPARLHPLTSYGDVDLSVLEEVEAYRESPDTPIVVIVHGRHHWRIAAEFLAVTDPYATNDIIGLRDTSGNYTNTLINRYQDERQILFYADEQFYTLEQRDQLPPVD